MQAYIDELCIILQGLPCETKFVFYLKAVGGEFLILIYLSSINFSLKSLISQKLSYNCFVWSFLRNVLLCTVKYGFGLIVLKVIGKCYLGDNFPILA